MMPSDKADRKALPAPAGPPPAGRPQAARRPGVDGRATAGRGAGRLLGLEQVSVESHLFDELGPTRCWLARFCARLRQHPELPPVSMKDVYLHPTVRQLAAVAATAPAPDAVRPDTDAATRAPDRHGGVPALRTVPAAASWPVSAVPRPWCSGPGRSGCSGPTGWSRPTCAPPRSASHPARDGRAAGAGQVAAARPLPAAAIPDLERGLPPLLAGPALVRANPLALLAGSPLYCSTCGRWARGSGAASLILARGTRPCAPTCSPSALAR